MSTLRNRLTRDVWRAVGGALSLLIVAACAVAQTDDDEAAQGEAEQAGRFEISESYFESWVFNHSQTAYQVRAQFERQLALNIDDVNRSGKLTDDQRRKLELAGRADIKRFFEDIERARKKFNVVRKDSRRLSEISSDVRPLQLKLATGVFGDESLFRKTLRGVLTTEAVTNYEQNQRQRDATRHRAKVEWFVAMLDNAMSLQDEQRQKVIRLLVEQTKPSRKPSDMDHYVIMWQLSRLPEETVRPLFDDLQWKTLQREFAQMRDIERHLRRQGYLSFGDEDAAAKDRKADPTITQK